MKVNEGSIFRIPLFMDKQKWKLTTKLFEKELENDFAFSRVIETTSSVLVETFNKVGPAHLELNEVIHSGIIFSPVQIFWDATVKKKMAHY